jgi:hypothetical protein
MHVVGHLGCDLASEIGEELVCHHSVEEHDGRMGRELLDPILHRNHALVPEGAMLEASE